MKLLFAIGVGSFLGGVLRYLLSLLIQTKINSSFPFATLSVNLIGCFAIGLVFALADKGNLSQNWQIFFASGVLGGFTTYSAFSYETFGLLRDGQLNYAFAYVLSSILLGVLATFLGYFIVKNIG